MEHTSHDSLTVARRIGEAGMEQAQADAIVWAIRETFKEEAANFATKSDWAILKGEIAEVRGEIAKVDAKIDTVKSELKSEISEFRSEFKDELTGLRAEISWMPLRVCWWMLLTLATAAGLLLTAQQLWNSGLALLLFG
ncbi:MAG: hypothetical protein F4234_06505 [Gammaproteobacteria bacterium]|nr:hypothetical protein [Gammaproteobacteria bacterium]MDE0479212.1 hypothetical protein [Gammaproteobacteria bacterium]MDE0509296.1 hypothetical protein [Gammaproteobacteria bacterium]MXX07063.1 hypothetical protein [Gammaproteobacteria bacterium]MXY91504.1 hypothetical protein [Gammaproteobacteria bacterium]